MLPLAVILVIHIDAPTVEAQEVHPAGVTAVRLDSLTDSSASPVPNRFTPLSTVLKGAGVGFLSGAAVGALAATVIVLRSSSPQPGFSDDGGPGIAYPILMTEGAIAGTLVGTVIGIARAITRSE